MKPFHILTYLFGDQDSKYAIVEINDALITAIASARRTIAAFSATHGGHTALDHHGCLTVHLLSEIPDSLMEDYSDCVADSLLIPDLDIKALLEEATQADLIQEAMDSGIVIGPRSICLVAHEAGWSLEFYSPDFLKLIEPHLPAETKQDSAATDLEAAALLALELIKATWPLEHGNPEVGLAWGALEQALGLPPA